MSSKKYKEFLAVLSSELCNRCGTCVGLSDGAIVFVDREGSYLPKIIKELSHSQKCLIAEACPGREFNFPKFNEFVFRDVPSHNTYLGSYRSVFIANATNPDLRLRGASGALLSSVLIYLFKSGKIDGAIVTRMSHSKPWLCEPFIATSIEEILEAAQSKYIVSSVNEILVKSRKFKGNLAYVGLPGQVHGIRKLQKMNHSSVGNIKYVFGPFYGNTLKVSSIKSFLKSHGEKELSNIKNLWFRYGEWPGSMRVEMRSGKVFELKKFHANYLIPFHILRNSLYCIDLSNEFADLSGGDAWAPIYEERGKGFSLAIVRSDSAAEIIREMAGKGLLELKEVTAREAISMHSHGYDFKKRGSFIRIKYRKLAGKSIPDYGYTLSGFPFSRYIMEIIVSTLFILLGTKLSQFLVEKLPPSLIGSVFERARIIWKKNTHTIKRKEL